MKFIAADVILLIVGVLLLGGATAGLMATPGGLSAIGGQSSPSGLFNVTYDTTQTAGESKQAASFASGSAEFTISSTNITKVLFAIACTDPAPSQAGAYQVQVNVQGPNGITKSQGGACGQFTVEVPVTTVPQGGTVEGDTEDEARANLVVDDNATKGTGKWTVSWTGQRQGNLGPIAGQFGNPSGSVASRIENWNADMTAVVR